MLLTEYDEEFHMKCEREIALEEGAVIGETKLLVSMIRKKYVKGLTEAEIAAMLELDTGYISGGIRLIKQYPEGDDAFIAEELLNGTCIEK